MENAEPQTGPLGTVHPQTAVEWEKKANTYAEDAQIMLSDAG